MPPGLEAGDTWQMSSWKMGICVSFDGGVPQQLRGSWGIPDHEEMES
jgi:hypothetical protein